MEFGNEMPADNECGIYVFDEPQQLEALPIDETVVDSSNNWNKFRDNVMENKNQQFDPKLLKQNLLLHDKPLNSNVNNKQNIHFIAEQKDECQKQSQIFFVAEDEDKQYQEQIINHESSSCKDQLQIAIAEIETSENQNRAPSPQLEKKKILKKKKERSLAGTTLNYHMDVPEIIIHNKKALLTNQIPEGIKLKCKLKRRKGLLSFISQEYDFYLESGFKHLVSAQKQILSQDKVFRLSMDVGEYSSKSVLCDMYCNALHSNYLLVSKDIQGKGDPYQNMYGEITYEKLNKSKEPRLMRVSLPYKVNVGVKPKQRKIFKFSQIANNHKIQLHSKQILDESQYPLESEKNFQLVDAEDDFCYLKLRKDSQNVFSIEIQHPLSPLQAFAIVLTRFDAQIR